MARFSPNIVPLTIRSTGDTLPTIDYGTVTNLFAHSRADVISNFRGEVARSILVPAERR
jgi:hypothetical protein